MSKAIFAFVVITVVLVAGHIVHKIVDNKHQARAKAAGRDEEHYGPSSVTPFLSPPAFWSAMAMIICGAIAFAIYPAIF